MDQINNINSLSLVCSPRACSLSIDLLSVFVSRGPGTHHLLWLTSPRAVCSFTNTFHINSTLHHLSNYTFTHWCWEAMTFWFSGNYVLTFFELLFMMKTIISKEDFAMTEHRTVLLYYDVKSLVFIVLDFMGLGFKCGRTMI